MKITGAGEAERHDVRPIKYVRAAVAKAEGQASTVCIYFHCARSMYPPKTKI
jgi:hypothetical protein